MIWQNLMKHKKKSINTLVSEQGIDLESATGLITGTLTKEDYLSTRQVEEKRKKYKLDS